MGYAHYYNFDGYDIDNYNKALHDVRKLVNKYQKKYNLTIISNEDTDEITFNGPEGKDCEDFILPKAGKITFKFCKTGRLPYDNVVTACLIIMAHVKGFAVSSDGEPDEWSKGMTLVESTFGEKYNKSLQDIIRDTIL